MRFFVMLVAISALSQSAMAQTPECKSLPEAAARLACYDKTAPPAASSAAAKQQRAPVSKVDTAKYVDTIGAEDAIMNARLKNICRGC
jgi:sugar/nucleoside kinase (ribokinase family)